MKRLLLTLAIAGSVGGLLSAGRAGAQVLPPAPDAARVEITKGPELESATHHLTIIRWTTNNPGGTDQQYGVVHYGTDPKDLNQTAKNPIRLNQGHADTTYRVRLDDLKPATTYYYTVTSEQSNGTKSRVKSAVKAFTTPRLGERFHGTFP
jgi:phosphodiesterase/alkaline phosphatase D-like protein